MFWKADDFQKQESGFCLENETMIQIQDMFEDRKPDIVLKTVKGIKFKLHPTNDRFPDALAPSYVKRSDWQAHFWNSREPAYQNVFTRFVPPGTWQQISFFENTNIYLQSRTGGSCLHIWTRYYIRRLALSIQGIRLRLSG